jgi:DMSO/TMAO reductase YedYZ molybdopterin-dependent catalytic subunit
MGSDRNRLPPGQREVGGLPVLHVGQVPTFDPETWTLEVAGEVDNPLVLTYEQFAALRRSAVVADFHCVTGWSRLGARWEGVAAREIVALARVRPSARHVVLQCEGGYSTNLPVEEFLNDDVLLAEAVDGQPLSPEHGWPLRALVPQKYAYKSAKWLRRIVFTRQEHLGFWETRGYSNAADPWKEQRTGRP